LASILKFILSICEKNALPRVGMFFALCSLMRKFYALYLFELCGSEFLNQIWFLLPLDAYLLFYFFMRLLNKQVGMGGANVYPDSKNGFKTFVDLLMLTTMFGLNVMWNMYMPSDCP
jgi:hypothetical protein